MLPELCLPTVLSPLKQLPEQVQLSPSLLAAFDDTFLIHAPIEAPLAPMPAPLVATVAHDVVPAACPQPVSLEALLFNHHHPLPASVVEPQSFFDVAETLALDDLLTAGQLQQQQQEQQEELELERQELERLQQELQAAQPQQITLLPSTLLAPPSVIRNSAPRSRGTRHAKPDDEKDEQYLQRRKANTESARRTRQRQKEREQYFKRIWPELQRAQAELQATKRDLTDERTRLLLKIARRL